MIEKDTGLIRRALRVKRVARLEPNRAPAAFTVLEEDGKSRTIILQKRKRQVFETLMKSPIYAASPVRLSDMVHLLKLEDGIDIETVMFPGDPGTGTTRFGVYVLRSIVERVSEAEAAA